MTNYNSHFLVQSLSTRFRHFCSTHRELLTSALDRDHAFAFATKLANDGALEDLECMQYALAIKIIEPCQGYLNSLELHRRLYLEKSLSWYIEQSIQGNFTRYPRPYDAPQPTWDLMCVSLKEICFNSIWQSYVKNTLLSIPGPRPYFESEVVLPWKMRAIQTHEIAVTLKNIEKQSLQMTGDHAIVLHQDMGLSDEQIATLVNRMPGLIKLELNRCKTASQNCQSAISNRIGQLHSLIIRECKKLDLCAIQLENGLSLTSLTLENVHLKNTPSLFHQLPNLENLDVSFSDFSDQQILTLESCPQIKRFAMRECTSVTPLGMSMLARYLPSLLHLDLSNCFSVYDDILSELPLNLRSLALSWCQNITDVGLSSMEEMLLQLHTLAINHCRSLGAQTMEVLAKSSHLRNLNLNYCRGLDSTTLEFFLTHSKGLTHLHMKGLFLFDHLWPLFQQKNLQSLAVPKHTCFEHVMQLPQNQLTYLDLGSCHYWKEPDYTQFFNSATAHQLHTLIIEDGYELTDSSMDSLTNLQQLRHLCIHGADHHPQLFQTKFSQLSKLKKLRHLEFSYSGICDKNVLKNLILELPELHTIDLGPMYKISDSELKELQKEFPWIYFYFYKYQELPMYT